MTICWLCLWFLMKSICWCIAKYCTCESVLHTFMDYETNLMRDLLVYLILCSLEMRWLEVLIMIRGSGSHDLSSYIGLNQSDFTHSIGYKLMNKCFISNELMSLYNPRLLHLQGCAVISSRKWEFLRWKCTLITTDGDATLPEVTFLSPCNHMQAESSTSWGKVLFLQQDC